MKKLIAALLIGSLFAFSLNAQTPPDATVDQDGNLVLNPGTPDEVTIPVPDGTVETDGSLTVGGNNIPAPNATVNPDGSITVDGNTLMVPDLPKGGAFPISWLGSDLYDYQPNTPPDQDQNYFSYTFKDLRHWANDNWFWFYEWKAAVYINPNTGSRNLDEGVWCYTRNLFPGQTEGTWFYLARKYQWHDLRDSKPYDGIPDLPDSEAGAQQFEGSLYVKNPQGYDTKGAGWFILGEYSDGNWIKRLGDSGAPWVKLTDPVNPSPPTN